MKKTALIAGGAGFIGSHLCKRLLDDGWRVICVDNLLTGTRENIKELEKNPNFEFVEQDITEPFENWKLKIENCDAILNLASPASPKDYQNHPLETMRTGSIGTENLLELAKKYEARFVHASTSEVYGEPLEHPQKESYWGNVNSYGPRAMYDEAKRYSEALIYNYRQIHKLSTGIARIFNTYGPQMQPDDGRVVSNFVVQALKNQPLTIYSDGLQTRSFCYIDDMVEGLMRLIEKDVQGPINLGNPHEFTVKELAQKVLAMIGSKSEITYLPKPPDDPSQRKPDVSKAKTELNWEPKVELQQGLKKTIDWFKQNL